MNGARKIMEDLYWVGANDRRLNLFENVYPIPEGVSYNAYLLLDEKTALIDTVDGSATEGFLESVKHTLAGRSLDYLIINHMEPDHCGALAALSRCYPDVTVVSGEKSFTLIRQFFGDQALFGNTLTVGEGSALTLGRHTLTFCMAPMVHWPEVMITFDQTDGTLFSADAFGTFGAVEGSLFAEEKDYARLWGEEARRYYANIVGKYGAPVKTLLKKASGLEIHRICPLHGPVLGANPEWLLDKYQKWSAYTPESEGVLVAYASIYGHTKQAAEVLAEELHLAGARDIRVLDVSVTHPSYGVAEAFRLGRWALLCPTYNMGIFPAMETLLLDLKAHALKGRRVALVENGSWSPASGKLMKELLESMKEIELVEPIVTLRSSLKEEQREDLAKLARALLA